MEKDIKQILQELHKIDNWLEINQKDLVNAIELLKQTKPTVKIDPNFKQNLKNEIFEEIKNKKIKNLKTQNNIFKNIIYVFWWIWIAAFWIFAINKDLFTNIDKIVIPKTTNVEIVSEDNLTTVKTNNQENLRSLKVDENILLNEKNIETKSSQVLENIQENKTEIAEKSPKVNLKSNSDFQENSIASYKNEWLKSINEESDINYEIEENNDEISVDSTFAPDMSFSTDLMDVAWSYEVKWFSYNKDLNLNFENKLLKSNDNFENIKNTLKLEKQSDYNYKNDFVKIYYNNYLWTIDINYNSWLVLKTSDYKTEINNYLKDLWINWEKFILNSQQIIDWKKYYNYWLNLNNFNIYNNYWDKIITTFVIDIEKNQLLNVKNLDINNYFEIKSDVTIDKKIINQYLNNYNWENPTSLKEITYLPRVIYVKYNKNWVNYISPALYFKDDYIVIILDKELFVK